MAVKYTSGNIQYTNVVKPAFLTTGRLAKGSYTIQNNVLVDKPGAFVNAIDIDWNSAYLPNLRTYINTTSDLLEQLDNIYLSISNISDNLDLSDYLKIADLPIQLTTDLLTNKLNSIYAPKSVENDIESIEQQLANKANKDDIPEIDINDFLEQLNDVYAPKSIETSITELTNSLSNKADKNEIPQRISDLEGFDNYATITWVNNQLRYYAKTPYDVYKQNQIDNGLPYMSETEWLNSLKGKDGINGQNGKTAFELAQDNGFIGNEEEWLASLKGEKGDRGEKGEMGAGINILGYYDTLEELKEATRDTINSIGDAYNVGGTFYVYNDEFGGDIDKKWKPAGSLKGDPGKSAFDIYRDFGGTIDNEEEWLASLKGEQGEQGEKGDKGDKGDPGNDIYQIYVDIQRALGKEVLPINDWVATLGIGTTYTAGEGIQISEDNVISIIPKDVWAIIQP